MERQIDPIVYILKSLNFGLRLEILVKNELTEIYLRFVQQCYSGLLSVVHPKAVFFFSLLFTEPPSLMLSTVNCLHTVWMVGMETDHGCGGGNRRCSCLDSPGFVCVSHCFLCFGGKIPPLLRTSPTRPIYLFQTSSHPDTFTWAEESALPVSSNLPLLLKAPPSRFLTPLTSGAGRCFMLLLPPPMINRGLD